MKTPEALIMASPSEAPRNDLNVDPVDAAVNTSIVNQDELHVRGTPKDERTHGWLPGTYVLLNSRSGTALDLSGADRKTALIWAHHGGSNQQVRRTYMSDLPIFSVLIHD